MSVLVDWQIEQWIDNGTLIIDPWLPDDNLQGHSYDVHLSNQLKTRSGRTYTIPPEGLEVYCGEFFLGCTEEFVSIPANMMVQVWDKSSRAREAVVFQTAGHAEGGFRGQITLEISQVDKSHSTLLLPGMPIAQLVFSETAMPRRPYGHKSLKSNYQGQRGPTRSCREVV